MTSIEKLARLIDAMNEAIGRVVSWVALLMVLVQFVVVMMRYVFGIGSTFMQESVVYMHSVLFMVAAGYTLLHNGHVRCDIYYSVAEPRRKALIDFCGVLLFLIPMCILIWWVSWPYVSAAWAVLEGSPEGRNGIPAVFLLKTVIPVFAVVLSLQGLSLALRSFFRLVGIDSTREPPEDGEGVTV